MTKGIDVSYCQRNVDWNKVKESGIDFAIIRAGFGKYSPNQIDSMFESHYSGATAANLHVGAYWYCYAKTVDQAKEEAEACLKVIKDRKFDFPIFYDIEEKDTFNSGNTSEIARTFCEILEDNGYFAGIYSFKSSLESYFSPEIRKRFCTWLAHWVESSSYSDPYDMHQYTDKGSVYGIQGYVDLNKCMTDFPQIIKDGGFNGYQKKGIPDKAPVRTVVDTVKKGDTGKYVALAQMLLDLQGFDVGKAGSDGKFGNDTEKAAKEFQKNNELKADGIIGPETWKVLIDITS